MIKSITKEQEAQIPAYIQKWIDAAEVPVDRAIAKERLQAIMPGRTILFAESPTNAGQLIQLLLDGKKAEHDSQLYSQLRSQLGSQSAVKWSYYVSYYWFAWAGYYDYATTIGVKFDKAKRIEFNELLLHAPIVIFVGNLVFVVEKPTIRGEGQNLGNDQKMAIEWKDGTGMYFLGGTKLEEDMWKQIVSRKMTLDEIFGIEDADVRSVALKYNQAAILTSGAELLDEHPTAGELFRIKGQKINEVVDYPEVYFLRMKCPSTDRVFVEAVDPEFAKKYPYALHCQAEAWDLPVEIYGQMDARNMG
jgi:hypothetical protein